MSLGHPSATPARKAWMAISTSSEGSPPAILHGGGGALATRKATALADLAYPLVLQHVHMHPMCARGGGGEGMGGRMPLRGNRQ